MPCFKRDHPLLLNENKQELSVRSCFEVALNLDHSRFLYLVAVLLIEMVPNSAHYFWMSCCIIVNMYNHIAAA